METKEFPLQQQSKRPVHNLTFHMYTVQPLHQCCFLEIRVGFVIKTVVPEPKNYTLFSLLFHPPSGNRASACLLKKLSVIPPSSASSPSSQLLPINILTFSKPTIFLKCTPTNTPSLQALPFLSSPCSAKTYQRVASPPCLHFPSSLPPSPHTSLPLPQGPHQSCSS